MNVPIWLACMAVLSPTLIGSVVVLALTVRHQRKAIKQLKSEQKYLIQQVNDIGWENAKLRNPSYRKRVLHHIQSIMYELNDNPFK